MIASTPEPIAVETSAELKESYFGLSSRPEDQVVILNILRNQLYTDKVTAVLREYGCNAYDANVEAGKPDLPIVVTLPTSLEPTLTIRDNGFGLDEQGVIEVFCRYGTSTKRQSNAYVGMLGIGSKSAFAYCDSFTIVSYHAGKKTTYNAYIDTSRVGKVAVLTSEPYDETQVSSGMEIIIPIRDIDIYEFNNKAARVFRYFRVPPVFNHASRDFKLDRPKVILAGKPGSGWSMTQHEDGREARTVIIMGNIGYPINPGAMDISKYGEDEESNIYSILYNSFEIEMPIGSVEISASREGLQYSEITKQALVTAAKCILEDLGQVATDSIASAPTLWDAMILYREIFQKRSGYGAKLGELVGKVTTWKGESLNGGVLNFKLPTFGASVSSVTPGPSYKRKRYKVDPTADRVIARDGVRFFINDTKAQRLTPARLQTLGREANLQESIIVQFDDDTFKDEFFKENPALTSRTWESFEAVEKWVDPNRPSGNYARSSSNSKHKTKVFVFNGRTNQTRSENWNTTDVDLENGKGVYVRIDKFDPTGSSCVRDANALNSVITSARTAGFGELQVVGIKVSIPDSQIGKGWIHLDEWFVAKLTKFFAHKASAQDYADWTHVDSWSDGCYYYADIVKTSWLDPFLKAKTSVGDLARAIKRTYKNPEKLEAVRVLCQDYFTSSSRKIRDAALNGVTSRFDLHDIYQRVLGDYPLLRDRKNSPFARCGCTDQVAVIEYIRALDDHRRLAARRQKKEEAAVVA